MIVNYKHKLVFHHVPKCAGSSIRYAMGNYKIKEFNGVINEKMISHPLADRIFKNKIYEIDESFLFSLALEIHIKEP